MYRKCFSRNRDAMSNIVVSIMMLGIVLTLIGGVLTNYMPGWAKNQEIGHMDDVLGSVTDFKSQIDSSILREDTGALFTSRVQLGTQGGPILNIGQTTGQLEMDPGTNPHISQYSVTDDDGSTSRNLFNTKGTLKFQGNNNYYQDQDYIYENGAVILVQDGQVNDGIIRINPNFMVFKDSHTDNITCYMTMVNLQSANREMETISSSNRLAVMSSTCLLTSKEIRDYGPTGSDVTVNITSRYYTAWEDFFTGAVESPERAMDPADYQISTHTWGSNDEYGCVNVELYNVNNMIIRWGIFEIDLR